jgi:hypothetical protein
MAAKGGNQRNQVADPMKTKTGKARLGPLGLHQLEELLSKSSRPKDKAKIKNHIRMVKSRKGFVEAVPVVSS